MITFPTSPTVGERFTANNKVWQWNGFAWDFVGATNLVDDQIIINSTNPVQSKVIQTELNKKQDTNRKGAADGYASLDANIKVPVSQIPYIEDTSKLNVGANTHLASANETIAGISTNGTIQNRVIESYEEIPTEEYAELPYTFVDIVPDNVLSGTGPNAVTGVTSYNIGGTHIENVHAGRYLILTHNSLTNQTPLPKEAIRITANTTAGVLTLESAITYTSTTPGYKIVNAYAIPGNGNTLDACIMTDDIVIEYPEVKADTNRNELVLYNEYGGFITGKRTFVFLKNPVLSATKFELVAPGELVKHAQHATSAPHWDELGSANLGYRADVTMTTALAGTLTSATYAQLVGGDFNLNHPRRFDCIKTSVAGGFTTEIRYTSLKKRDILLRASCAVERSAGSPEVTIAIGKWDGAQWVAFDTCAGSAIVTTTATINTIETKVIDTVEFGNRYTILYKTTAAFKPLRGGFKILG
jgi:hypothetical protein